MSRPVVLDPRAERELEDAVLSYEQQQAGLGKELVDAVQDVLDRIGRTPGLHAVVLRDIRRARVRRFPNSVFDRVLNDRIEVVSVFHEHRDPAVWQSRV